jgi:hypothetical protein
MKRLIMAIVCLMTMVFSANAQNGWEKTKFPGDELKGEKETCLNIYTNDEGSFVFSDEKDDGFMVTTQRGFFDYDIDNYAKGTIIGLYDQNGVLLEKMDLPTQRTFFTTSSSNHKTMGCIKKAAAKKIISFIKEQKGYVRIIAERYSRTDFDIKVPCMNN